MDNSGNIILLTGTIFWNWLEPRRCSILENYRNNSVTPANKRGQRSLQEDSPVIDTSLYDKLKAVRGDEGRILDLVEFLFNQENEKSRKIFPNGNFEQTE